MIPQGQSLTAERRELIERRRINSEAAVMRVFDTREACILEVDSECMKERAPDIGEVRRRKRCMRCEPTKTSRSWIKRLGGLSKPHYRLRADTLRIFHDITAGRVEILAIVDKAKAAAWLEREGQRL